MFFISGIVNKKNCNFPCKNLRLIEILCNDIGIVTGRIWNDCITLIDQADFLLQQQAPITGYTFTAIKYICPA
jgi:hypothetical protein